MTETALARGRQCRWLWEDAMIGRQGRWRQERCGGCGYLLAGLGERGRCPECGEEFPGDGYVIFGDEAGWTGWRMYAAVVVGMVWIGGTAMGLAVTRVWGLALVYAVASLAFAVLVGRGIWRQVKGVRRQMRVSARGFGARWGAGPVVMHRWGNGAEVTLVPAGEGKWRLKIQGYTLAGTADYNRVAEVRFVVTAEVVEELRGQIEAWKRGDKV